MSSIHWNITEDYAWGWCMHIYMCWITALEMLDCCEWNSLKSKGKICCRLAKTTFTPGSFYLLLQLGFFGSIKLSEVIKVSLEVGGDVWKLIKSSGVFILPMEIVIRLCNYGIPLQSFCNFPHQERNGSQLNFVKM